MFVGYSYHRFKNFWTHRPNNNFTFTKYFEEEKTQPAPPPKHQFRCFYNGDMIDDVIEVATLAQFNQVPGTYQVEGQNATYSINGHCLAVELKNP